MITFTTVFVILFFIFVLQGIWLFIAELAGKDLDTFTIFKFLSFYAPTIVPLVLPLSVLLASIMTFGSFAENYEFAAMKSSGISLQRAMKMLTITIGILSLVSFVFANNVIPEAQYRFLNLRKNIIQQKPAMAIAEGQFNNIGTITIKVDKKSGDKGELLEGVIMHMKNNQTGNGANTVIKAKKGILRSETNSNYLQLELLDGNYYENIQPKDFNDRKKLPFAKSSFEKYTLNIDLTKLNAIDENDSDITSEKMLNINELSYTVDSLQRNYNKDVLSFSDNLVQRVDNVFNKDKKDTLSINKNKSEDLLSYFGLTDRKRIIEIAKSNATSTQFSIENSKNDLEYKKKNINSHWIVYHEKFMIAYSCLLMFFIGAPLGAIIRKGGIGLPIVFAIIIFIAFHFMNVFGRKLAEEDAVPAYVGMWLSSFVLTPLAIFLTYRATNDIGIMVNFDWLTDPFKKIFSKNNKEISFKKEIVSLQNILFEEENEIIELRLKNDAVLKGIVKNSDQFGYSQKYRLKAIKVLEERGISQEQLKLEGNLYNENYLKLNYTIKQYNIESNIALFFYILSFVFSGISVLNNIIIFLFGFINLIFMYYYIYQSCKTLDEIGDITKRNNFTNTYVALLFGFPFFIFVHFYNKYQLKESLKEFNS